MRIAYISQWFDPEQGSAALPGVIARALANRGHEVHVLTGFPNYPDGKLYPGYSVRAYQRESFDGVVVHRAPLWVNHDDSALRRAGNYLTFAGAASLVALSRLPEVDVAWVHSTPATTAMPALALQSRRGTPFVLHVQDLWPDTVTASGFLSSSRASAVERGLHRFCDFTYRRARHVAVTAPGMAERLLQRGVPGEKVSYVPNWADESAFRPLHARDQAKKSLGVDGRFTVMYAGNFGEFQSLDTIVRAAERLRHRQDIAFVLVGGGVEESRLKKAVSSAALSNVVFVPSQPFDRMAHVLAAGDVQVISLRDRPLSRTTLPSKLQATLAAGRPLIGAIAGDAARVILDSGAGLCVTPGSDAEMAAAAEQLAALSPGDLEAMGVAARSHYEQTYAEQAALDRIEAILSPSRQGVLA